MSNLYFHDVYSPVKTATARARLRSIDRQNLIVRALELLRGSPLCQHCMERAKAQAHLKDTDASRGQFNTSHDALRQLLVLRY